MSTTGQVTKAMRELRLGAIWQAFVRSPLSFKLVCLYVFFEYVRPQSIYEFLAGPPWALMSILAALVAFLVEGRRPKLPMPVLVTLGAFSVVFVLSGIFAENPAEAIKDFKLFANWLLIILLISGTVNTERRWFIFLCAFLLFSLKMSQHGFRSWIARGFAFTGWGVTGGPGWFANSGEFALQMGIFVPLTVYFYLALRPQLRFGKRILVLLLPISGVASIVASSSRGGLVALGAVGLWAALRSRHRVRALAALLVLAPLIWLAVPSAMKARFDTAGTDATSVLRLRYWTYGMEMAREHPLLGVGVGNWESYYRNHYYVEGDTLNRLDMRGRIKIEVAHNSFVEVGSQMGYTGLAAFVAILASILVVNRRTRLLLEPIGKRGAFLAMNSRALDDGVIAFCIAGFFMSVALYPFVWFQVAMTVALHSSAIQLVREHRSSVPSRPTGSRNAKPHDHRSPRRTQFVGPASVPSPYERAP